MSLNQIYPRPIHIGSIDFVSGAKKSLDLPRDGRVTQYNLRLRYTVTNGGVAPVGPLFQALARLIRRVDIRLGGRDLVCTASGEMLAFRAQYEWGQPAKGMDDNIPLGIAAVTAFDVVIPIPRVLPRCRTPLFTADELRLVKQATMEITWGNADCSDLFTTPNGAAISAVSLDVEAEYLMNVALDRTQPNTWPRVRYLTEINQDVNATNNDLTVTIDGQNSLLFRSLAIASLSDNIGDNTPLDAGGVKVTTGADTLMDRQAVGIQGKNRIEFSLPSLITGAYYHPFTDFGDVSQAINTSPTNITADLKARFNIVKGAGVQQLILSSELIRPLNIGVQ